VLLVSFVRSDRLSIRASIGKLSEIKRLTGVSASKITDSLTLQAASCWATMLLTFLFNLT